MTGLLADLLAPLRCVSCGRHADGDLCPACAEDLDPVLPPWCDRCGGPVPVAVRAPGTCAGCRRLGGFDRARSLVRYGGPASRLALALKRRGRVDLATHTGRLLAELARREGLDGASAVAFVPAGRRARAAGFDHARLLGSAVAEALDLRLRPALYRLREGPRQADVPLAERRRNAEGRFAARPVSGRILLVDDVFTTGATAEACSGALRAAGARAVDVLTWARTVRRRPLTG